MNLGLSNKALEQTAPLGGRDCKEAWTRPPRAHSRAGAAAQRRCSTDLRMRRGGVAKRFAWLGIASLMCGPMCMASDSTPGEDRCWIRAKDLFGDAVPERNAVETKMHSQPPKVLKRVRPSFPSKITDPRSSCLHVLHEALVSPTGDVAAVWSVRRKQADACPEFEEPAAAAIREWKYSPLLIGQRAVPFCIMVSTTIDVR